MKKISITALTMIMCLLMSSCASEQDVQGSSVDQDSISVSDDYTVTVKDADGNDVNISPENTTLDSDVDFDFLQMSSTVIYAQVFDLMMNYDDYVGNTFRMNGTFYESLDLEGIPIYFIIINDATGCCPQGLELKFSDDMEIPKPDSNITVVASVDVFDYKGEEYVRMLVSDLEIL